MVLGISFPTLSKADIRFAERKLVWRTYTAAEALLITRRVEIIDKREFAVAALNADNETFLVYVTALVEITTMLIYSFYQAQVAALTSEKTRIPTKYSDFSNVFSSNPVAELPEYTGINNHSINLLNDRKLLYGPIYSLRLLELETLKTYIKTNLDSGFIRPFKSHANILILFIRKKDISLHLYVDYRGLNNLINKNYYPLPLISKLFNCLGCAKRFIQLDLINAYH